MPKLRKNGGSFSYKGKQHKPVSNNPIGRPRVRELQPKATKINDMLHMLWADDYWPLIEKLLSDHPDLAQVLSAFVLNNRGRYIKRLADEGLCNYLKKEKFKIATVLQQLLAIGHQQKGTEIIKLLSSIVAMKQRVDTMKWKADVKAGILLTKATTNKYVAMMTACKPAPNIESTKWIVQVCIDQLHLYRGCTKGHYHRAVERVDEDGKKVHVEAITVMNLHEYPVDNHELGMTEEEADNMRTNGPYTEPLSEVYDELDFQKATQALYSFWDEDCDILSKAQNHIEQSGNYSAFSDNDVDEIVSWALILGDRPQHIMPKTDMIIHKPLCDRDTNCYDDVQSVWSWILQKWPEAVCIVVHSDGQCNGMIGNAKGIRPERFVAAVPMAADMHAEGHIGTYSTHEMFYECLSKSVADHLEFKKIIKKVMDLDKDRFDNHKDFQLALGIACKVVLILQYGFGAFCDVHRLEAMVDANPGHKVLFYYALMAGGPSLMWQRAQRSDRMSRLNQCWAYGFHTARCTHKTNYQIYSVMRAHSIRCTHPRIQYLLHLHPSMNHTGRMGCGQAKDRRVEYMHAECKSFNKDPKHSFEDALFFTEHFSSLDHASTHWHEAIGLEYSTPMEASSGFKLTVKAMVRFVLDRLEMFDGNTTHNPFTGNEMYCGDYRIKQPWLFYHKIGAGLVGPVGFPTSKKSWRQVVTHILSKDMFRVSPNCHEGLDEENIDEDWSWLDDNLEE